MTKVKRKRRSSRAARVRYDLFRTGSSVIGREGRRGDGKGIEGKQE